MPLYNYRCSNLMCLIENHEFHARDAAPEVKCEFCGSIMKKLLSAVPAKFKNDLRTIMSDGSKIHE